VNRGQRPRSVGSAWRAGLLAGCLAAGCATGAPPVTKIVGGREISTRSVDPNAYEYVGRALLYEEERRYEEAIAEIKRALNFDPDSPELHARLAELDLRVGRLDEAAAAVKDSLARGESGPGLVAEAHLRQRRGDLEGAVASLRRAAAVSSFDEEPEEATTAHLELADAQLVALQVEPARETLRTLANGLPASVAARVRLAGVAWALGDRAETETRLREALTIEPNQLDALLLLGWLYAADGRGKDAEARFREALERSEGSPDVGVTLARFLVSTGAKDAAAQVVDDLTTPATDDTALFASIELERAARRTQQALALARARRNGADVNEELRGRLDLTIAELLEADNAHKAALDVLLAFPKAAPGFADARVRAAAIERERGKPDEALRMLDEALAAAGQTPSEALEIEIALARTLCDEKAGAPDRALRRLDEALTRRPGTAKLVLAKAALLERHGRWREALDVTEKLLGEQPGLAEALNFWGFVAADNGHDLPRARQRLRAAVALDPGSGAILDSLGWVHLRAGELAPASVFIEEAGRLEPEDPEILGHLAELYGRRGERERAEKTLRKALAGKAEDAVRRRLEEQLRRLTGAKGKAG
jgi:tetratricopeptide (TPR) repeat protein